MTCRRPYFYPVSLLLTLVLWVATVAAQDKELGAELDSVRRELTSLEKAVPVAKDDGRLAELRGNAFDLQGRLQQGVGQIAPQLSAIDARIAQLGEAPEGVKEQRDLATQRRTLEQARASLDGQAKFASLLLVEVEQALSEIAARRRTLFQERLSERISSPLGKRFWIELKNEWESDSTRIHAAFSHAGEAVADVPTRAWVSVLIASLATLLVRMWLSRLLLRIMIARHSHRSLRALTYVVLWTLTGVLIARWFGAALTSGADPSTRAEALITALVASFGFGTYIAALGATWVSTCAPMWRLNVLPEAVAAKLRSFPGCFAAVVVLTVVVEQVAATINLSLATTVALEGLMATLQGAVFAIHLQRIAPRRIPHWGRHTEDVAAPPTLAMPVWASILLATSWLVLGAAAVCLLLGYLALASFIIKQFGWAVILLSTALLLARAITHVITALLEPKGIDTHVVTSRVDSARLQAAVLLSALAQITIGFFALLFFLAPYGAGPAEFLEHASRAQEGLSIGQIQLRPAELGRALVVLVLGVIAVRGARRWMQERFLPLTPMDAGMRDSVASLAAYVGFVIVIALALSALGVGLQQIAWVASALAVGIGFGLQAIVQNFVSGLILLAERPVRVGDWVSLGDIEGDVRRINARATEIQKGDRSTVIVPNSEFITKAVRNVTHNSPLGLVQFKLPLPLATDIERVRSEVMQAFQSHKDILRDPAPSVMIDGVDNVNIVFNAVGFVSSPRAAYGVRSAILFDALNRIRAAGLR